MKSQSKTEAPGAGEQTGRKLIARSKCAALSLLASQMGGAIQGGAK